MVCGSIGYGGIDQIRHFYLFLCREGFDVVDHSIDKGMDYSNIKDFRNKKELCRKIVDYDLKYIKKPDIIVVLNNGPRYGAAILEKRNITSKRSYSHPPCLVNFSDYLVTSEKELVELLHELERN